MNPRAHNSPNLIYSVGSQEGSCNYDLEIAILIICKGRQ